MPPNRAGGVRAPACRPGVETSRWCIVVVAAGFLWAAPSVLAQTEPPRWEVAAGAMFGAVVGLPCDELDGAMLTDCTPRSREWWISPAYHITERVALVGEVSGRFFNLKTSVTPTDSSLLPLSPELPPVAVDVSTSTYAFGGGVRVAGRRGRRVTPFVQAIVSYARIDGSASFLFFREPFAYPGLLIEPSGGVDLRVGERVAVRILAGYGAEWAEGELTHAVRVGAGVVFGLGRR